MVSSLGPPWERPLRGRFERHFIDSEILRGNPLGDPERRPLYVYLPPGIGDGPHVSVYVIQGMTGQLDMWLNRSAFEPNMIERLDELFASTDCPPAVVVMVDAWTSVGGSQFINSAATGRYLDYLCDEVVPFVDERFPTSASRDHRGLSGKSSGGYGAMVVPMLRPDVFSGLVSHAGDALFEACYLPEFPLTTRVLRDRFESSYELFWKHFRSASSLESSLMGPLNTYAMAACYSPDEDRPGEVVLPFEIDSGKLVDEVWARWLEWDPVRMAPQRHDALRSLRHVYLDAGRSDEYYLDVGAQAVAKELRKLGVEHTLELFDGSHGGLQYRYPGAIAGLVAALSE
ncbi:MAG TPA: alpha/beta hydrolase-fold protein [Actinomycetota bacterium]|nr:alpha/beta hydrolase-fold protein [Actinomycetota bacterium]